LDYYSEELEIEMLKFYDSLSEKDQRRYAAIEAKKLGHGGIKYISELFGCHRNTITEGKNELENTTPEEFNKPVIRVAGGGRKSCFEQIPELDQAFLGVVQEHTAGDPMQAEIKWTYLNQGQIVEGLKQQGIKISKPIVRQLLDKHNYVKRKAQKQLATGQTANRNEQFENINRLKQEYMDAGNPIMSIDTKKKEYIGNLYRDGKLYTTEVVEVLDHDFPNLASGVIIPYGIYDIQRNEGFINLGNSRDTTEFACDSIRQWWQQLGQFYYAFAKSILLLCDGGGSNSSNYYIFKEDLQKLATEIGIEIRVAHYPPYTSKYNPIEHRLFPHVTRACQGAIFTSIELVKSLIEKTSTKTGLSVIVNLMDKVYAKGREVADGFKENLPIIFDEYLPKWNYRAIPKNN
jgi:hypothetical protein